MELFMTGELLTDNHELHLSAWFDQALAAAAPDTMAFNLQVVELEHLLSGRATAHLHGPEALSFKFPAEHLHDVGCSWDDIASYLVAHMLVPIDITSLESFKDSLAVFSQKVVGPTGWVHGVRISASIVLLNVRDAGSSSGVENLRRFTYAELLADGDHVPDDHKMCPICLEQLDEEEEDEFLVKTPCEHVFHHQCLARWLKKSCACPMCRFKMSDDDDA